MIIHRDRLGSFVYVLIVMGPVLLRWVLPESIEMSWTINFFGWAVFVPEFLWLIIFFYWISKNKWRSNKYFFCACLMLYIVVVIALNSKHNDLLLRFPGLFDIFFPLLFFFVIRFERKDYESALVILMLVYMYIVLQVFLYSYGFMNYEYTLSKVGYYGVERINTTIGASTGTAIILFLLMFALVLILNNINKQKLVFFVVSIGLVAVLITMSRGGVLAAFIFVFFYYYKVWVTRTGKSAYYLFLGGFGFIILFFVVNSIGLFEVFISRLDDAGRHSDFTSGRVGYIDYLLNVNHVGLFEGYGVSGFDIAKRFRYVDVQSLNLRSPHNMYILQLLEFGWLGMLMYILLLVLLMRYSGFHKKNTSIGIVYFILVFLVINNVESVMRDIEYGFFMVFNVKLLREYIDLGLQK